MAIQTLTHAETAQISGAFFFDFFSALFGFDPATNTGSGSGIFPTPFGTFSGFGSANPTDGGSRTVNYSGPFGNFGNTAGFSPTQGFNFSFF